MEHDGLDLQLLGKHSEDTPTDGNREPEILEAQAAILQGSDDFHKEVVQFVAAAKSLERVWGGRHPDDFAHYFKLKAKINTMYEDIAATATQTAPPTH